MDKNEKNKKEFSKVLLVQESGLLWVVTIGFLLLALYCIYSGYTGSLPWLAAMSACPWAAYGVSQVWYYKKSTVENSIGGIKYDTVLMDLKNRVPEVEEYDCPTYSENDEVDTDYGI